MRRCADDEGFVALRRRPSGEASNHLKLRWLKTVVVSVRKRRQEASGGDRKGERGRTVDEVSKQVDDIKTGAVKGRRDEPGGVPPIGQAVSGIEAARVRSAASARNMGRRVPIRPTLPQRGELARGSAPGGGNREALSTDAARAGGPVRSSDEASVIWVERRGRLIGDLFARTTGSSPGGNE